MSSNIQRGGKYLRPSFNFTDRETFTSEQITAQMLESIRNFLEDCQMMQCDVAHAIKRMDKTLARIDKRLAKIEGAKLR